MRTKANHTTARGRRSHAWKPRLPTRCPNQRTAGSGRAHVPKHNQCTSPKPTRRQPTKRKSQWPATATSDSERHSDNSECTPHCRGPGSANGTGKECKHGDKRKMGGWEGGGVCCFEGRWGRAQQTQTSQQTRTPPLHWQHGHCTASGRPSGGHRMSLNAWGHWARTTPRVFAGPNPRPPCRSNLDAKTQGVERGT